MVVFVFHLCTCIINNDRCFTLGLEVGIQSSSDDIVFLKCDDLCYALGLVVKYSSHSVNLCFYHTLHYF